MWWPNFELWPLTLFLRIPGDTTLKSSDKVHLIRGDNNVLIMAFHFLKNELNWRKELVDYSVVVWWCTAAAAAGDDDDDDLIFQLWPVLL